MRSPGPIGGDLLARRYRLIDRVGAGGMSVVWRARDEVLDRLVAVKWLGTELADDDLFRDLVRREAWATARIKHPAVAAVYDYGEVPTGDGQSLAYVVMEMLDGESLADRLRRGPLPWREAVSIAAEVADALATAHEQGVVHRDISPDNVMLTSSGLRVFDFGIAAPDRRARRRLDRLDVRHAGLRRARAPGRPAGPDRDRRVLPRRPDLRDADRRAALPGGHLEHRGRPDRTGRAEAPGTRPAGWRGPAVPALPGPRPRAATAGARGRRPAHRVPASVVAGKGRRHRIGGGRGDRGRPDRPDALGRARGPDQHPHAPSGVGSPGVTTPAAAAPPTSAPSTPAASPSSRPGGSQPARTGPPSPPPGGQPPPVASIPVEQALDNLRATISGAVPEEMDSNNAVDLLNYVENISNKLIGDPDANVRTDVSALLTHVRNRAATSKDSEGNRTISVTAEQAIVAAIKDLNTALGYPPLT